MDENLREELKQKWNLAFSQETFRALQEDLQWIRMTRRIQIMQEKEQLKTKENLYMTFSFDHHVSSALELFKLYPLTYKVSVVYGHKQQGKSQFLFFLVKLLQKLNEIVVYLDKIILPNARKECDTSITEFWSKELGDKCKTSLELFKESRRIEDLGHFFGELQKVAENRRVWVIVDEVVEFNKDFPIDLPEEQVQRTPFYWIVTGSAGISSWVSGRHLERCVFDLPLFTSKECLEHAITLCRCIGYDLNKGIEGIYKEGLEEWLDEKFGGVIGYVAEFFLEMSADNPPPISAFIASLYNRVNSIISAAAKKRSLSCKALVDEWFCQIKNLNTWIGVCNAGLCGRKPPRGVILSILLKIMFCYIDKERTDKDLLDLVKTLRKRITDAGLDGCLLELEEILKLRTGSHFRAVQLKLVENVWTKCNVVDLPTPHAMVNRYNYSEQNEQGSLNQEHEVQGSAWHLIELPFGFDIIDVALVDKDSSTMYGIQITRSCEPFKAHHTPKTCSDRSRERLKELKETIGKNLGIENVEFKYTLVAPNCQENKHKPRAEHNEAFYFSPETALQVAPNPKKRKLMKKASSAVV